MEFEKRYAEEGLTCIGSAMDEEGWRTVKPYLEEHPINYRIVLGHPILEQPFAITNLPITILIDRQGRIADRHLGVVDKDRWEEQIRSLLHETRE
jgi:cytochrome c biogenesis protein CcmG/thiol:disulfide interchange protein DsbE